MPKALFFNVPAYGHVNPSLPLVTELVRRGHQITYFITPAFRNSVEAAGAAFQPYPDIHDDYFDARGLHGGLIQKVVYELMKTAQAVLPELLQMASALQPDYILYDGMCPWGCMVARILKRPSVASLALLPLSKPPARLWFSPHFVRMFLPAIFRDFRLGMQANQRAQALAKHYHVQPLGQMQLMNAPADLEISYTSSYFQPRVETVSPRVCFVGRTIDDNPLDHTAVFAHVNDRPLIYISLGTLNNDDAVFFKHCIQAFAGQPYAVIMSTGQRISPETFGQLPENIAIYDWVPQAAVMKRASLFITHAGLNSVHDGLYFGVPLLLVPQQIEQCITALRVAELGAGLLLDPGHRTAHTIRHLANRLLAEPQFKAEAVRIGETLRSAGGMSRAADAVETMLKTSDR